MFIFCNRKISSMMEDLLPSPPPLDRNFPQLSAPRNISSLLFPALYIELSLSLFFSVYMEVEEGFPVDPVAVFCVATAVKCVIAGNLRRVSEFTRWPPQ